MTFGYVLFKLTNINEAEILYTDYTVISSSNAVICIRKHLYSKYAVATKFVISDITELEVHFDNS